MKYLQIGIIAGAIFLLGIVLAIRIIPSPAPSFGGTGLLTQAACTVSTVNTVPIGNQNSSTLIPANGRRAWAIVQQPLNATNTISLAFATGTSATLTSGISLENASTTNGLSSITFGLNTNFTYTGAVTGITSTGSSTVNITVCNF